MTNARQEFLEHLEVANKEVRCAFAHYKPWYNSKAEKMIRLNLGYSATDFDYFLHGLDFIYDSGCGSQEIFGTIWYTDGSWSTRAEYEGSEWWEYNTCPDIPDELKS